MNRKTFVRNESVLGEEIFGMGNRERSRKNLRVAATPQGRSNHLLIMAEGVGWGNQRKKMKTRFAHLQQKQNIRLPETKVYRGGKASNFPS